jgi:hypothetical protein
VNRKIFLIEKKGFDSFPLFATSFLDREMIATPGIKYIEGRIH